LHSFARRIRAVKKTLFSTYKFPKLKELPHQRDERVIIKSVSKHQLFRPAMGAVLTILCGVALCRLDLGERWVNTSYDYLFRFSVRPVTNDVVLVLMDSGAHRKLQQTRGAWSRSLYAQLLNKLAQDECPLVVMDVAFLRPGDPQEDSLLAAAMGRLRSIVIAAKQEDSSHPGVLSAAPTEPTEPFLSAAQTNWGVAWLKADLDSIVRRHWPFSAPSVQYRSLPWEAAALAGARLGEVPQERWLRYYGRPFRERGHWTYRSYDVALSNAPGFFRGKTVFIGNRPENSDPASGEKDNFRTPYTRWTGEAAAGVDILVTQFLNLVNGEWLRRPPGWLEFLLLCATGILLGAGLPRYRRLAACGVAAVSALAITLAAVSLSYYTNYWVPWLVIAGGQVPSALAWAVLAPRRRPDAEAPTREDLTSRPTSRATEVIIPSSATLELPHAPDYELFDPPFAEGAYGKVWLARNAIGQWQALKAVYRAKFGAHTHPYEQEFNGIRNYKPISDKHPGLLRVDFVSMQKPAGYFYYVMELGDSLEAGWQQDPARYLPRDLAKVRSQAPGRRLPAHDCLRIVIDLAEALEFLHRQGLTHRDIKPQNIIFVNGRPKLADVGLVAEVLPPDRDHTWVGTPGYMPPPPEPPGTPQADIYGLGMVLYVIVTGRDPAFFPEVSTTLGRPANPVYERLMSIILNACEPDRARRYGSAGEMHAALCEAQKALQR
jgi:CHASE2 domain-containing sensor protein